MISDNKPLNLDQDKQALPLIPTASDQSKLKPQKSILKTEKSFLNREKSTLKGNDKSLDRTLTFERFSSFAENPTTTEKFNFTRKNQQMKEDGTRNFLIKDFNVESYVNNKLPAFPKEYTAWVLNTNFKPPTQFNDFSSSQLDNDWSKFKEEVFSGVEASLKNVIKKREKSSHRRCDKIERKRNSEHYKSYCFEILGKYDEEIKLDELMKSNNKYNALATQRRTNGPNNYQLLLADEKANRKCHCYRFIEKNLKFDENEIVHMFDKDKRRIYKLPSLKKKKRKGKWCKCDYEDEDSDDYLN